MVKLDENTRDEMLEIMEKIWGLLKVGQTFQLRMDKCCNRCYLELWSDVFESQKLEDGQLHNICYVDAPGGQTHVKNILIDLVEALEKKNG